MRTTRRTEGVSVLTAAAILLVGAGQNAAERGGSPTLPYALAAGAFIWAFLWVASPENYRVGYWTLYRRWRERVHLHKWGGKDGWLAFPGRALGTVPLHLRSTGGKQLPGFLCEVQAPTGLYVAYTEDAKEKALSLQLPPAKHSAHVNFPNDFTAEAGAPVLSSALMGRGKYYVLWYAWRGGDMGVPELDFVTSGCFRSYMGGIGPRRKAPRCYPRP